MNIEPRNEKSTLEDMKVKEIRCSEKKKFMGRFVFKDTSRKEIGEVDSSGKGLY